MATLVARIALPTTRASLFSTCARGARLGLFVGSTGLLGAHVLTKPATMMTQCQGGVAPRYQYTRADPEVIGLRKRRAIIDLQQLSSGSVLGMITGYLTAKIGRLFLFSFGGLFLLGAVFHLLRYKGVLPSPWPFLRRTLHVDAESLENGDLATFLRTNTTFKASFLATFLIGLLYS